MNNSNQPYNKEYPRLLRHDMTPSEWMLWKHISDKQLDGWRFRRQHGFGPYVLDFYCPVLKLCIEVDGEIHQRTDVVEKDKERTSFLESNGKKVIRFTNDEIENDISDVLERIRRFINNNSFNLRYQKK